MQICCVAREETETRNSPRDFNYNKLESEYSTKAKDSCKSLTRDQLEFEFASVWLAFLVGVVQKFLQNTLKNINSQLIIIKKIL